MGLVRFTRIENLKTVGKHKQTTPPCTKPISEHGFSMLLEVKPTVHTSPLAQNVPLAADRWKSLYRTAKV